MTANQTTAPAIDEVKDAVVEKTANAKDVVAEKTAEVKVAVAEKTAEVKVAVADLIGVALRGLHGHRQADVEHLVIVLVHPLAKQQAHGLAAFSQRNNVADEGGRGRRFEAGAKAVQQPQQQKARDGGGPRIKEAAHKTNQ